MRDTSASNELPIKFGSINFEEIEFSGSRPVEFGTDKAQYFGNGSYRFHPTGIFSPEDLSGR
jgi:hypothetical protein